MTIASTDSVRLLGVAGQLRKKGAVRYKRRLAQRNPSAVDLASVVPDFIKHSNLGGCPIDSTSRPHDLVFKY